MVKEGWLWIITTLQIIGVFHANGCWEEERAGLLHIKAYFSHRYHPDCVKSWKEDKRSDCCDGWDGVSCGIHGRVVTLSLRGCYAQVQHLNASLFLPFQQLTDLDLSSNGIVSWQDVGKVSPMLKKLEKLDLSNNRINRSIDILPQLKGFHSLKSLSLRDNEISGFIPFCDIEALRNLEELDLGGNYLMYGFMNCNGSSSNLTNLKTLDLSDNSLNNKALQHLSRFQSLEHLRLQSSMHGGIKQPYGLCLCALQKLQTLDLSHNQLNEMLPPCLGNLTALRVLDLSWNELAGRIPSWLSNLSALQKLNLSQNHFAGNIATSVLVNLTNIELLELSGNHFQILYSFKSFANHTKLKYFAADYSEAIYDTQDQNLALRFQLQVLSLSNCRLTTYPPFLYRQYNLLVVDLSHNSLHGNFPTWLLENSYSLKGLFLHSNSISSFQPSSSSHHANMVALDISLNKIQGPILEHIGEIFPRLQLLYMFSNELQGNIPWSLGHLKSLLQLDLSNNSLVGTLPNSLLENCLLLQSLIVSDNQLEGLIPSFYQQRELEILVIGNNLMEGPIPRGICRLHKLEYLDLSHNKLDGSIPSCFSNLSIERIHLSNNKLSGPIILPKNYVVTLDLSNNKLKGSIPSQIANLAYLNVLLLSGNALEDEIPLQLCSLTELMMLDLSHNMLSGSLPSCLGRVAFRNTRVMGILTDDSLPDDLVDSYAEKVQYTIGFVEDPVNFMTKSMAYSYKLGTLDVLSGIDLSSNMLTGKIPYEFGNLTLIQSINLSHNHLWGEIPESFSNLTQIESLDLSYNNFSGRIPTELTALHFLSVLRVEHNNLSGEIPLESQFSTFTESSYQGNPFLCGPPLTETCASMGLSPTNSNGLHDQLVEDDSGGINMEIFYVTFLVTGITMFLVVLVVFWINPNWQKSWFCLVTHCILSGYYFVQDSIRKIKRVMCI